MKRVYSLGIVCLLAASSAAFGFERLVRIFDFSSGLRVTEVHFVTQDRQGFIWIGAGNQLLRYDGREYRSWSTGGLHVADIVDDLHEGIVVRLGGRRLAKLHDGEIESWEPPVEPAIERVIDLRVTQDDSLWIADALGLRRRSSDGVWTSILNSSFDDHELRRMFDRGDEGLLVAGQVGLWSVDPDGKVDLIYMDPSQRFEAVQKTEKGLFVLVDQRRDGSIESRGDFFGQIVDGEIVVHHTDPTGRADHLVARDDAVWLSYRSHLMRWHPEEGIERIGAGGTFFGGGGGFFLDREGSLWMGMHTGMAMLPEPSTKAWTSKDGRGLKTAMYQVTPTETGVYASDWTGISFIDARSEERTRWLRSLYAAGPICEDDYGTAWQVARRFDPDDGRATEAIVLALRNGQIASEIEFDEPGHAHTAACTKASGGNVWLLRNQTLLRTRPGGRPEPIGEVPVRRGIVLSILETSDNELWVVTGHDTVCHTGVARVSEGPDAWHCEKIDAVRHVTDIKESSDGTLWLRASVGLLVRHVDSWLPFTSPQAGGAYLSASSRGGIWTPSLSGVFRLEATGRPDGPARVVESLGLRHGLPTMAVTHVAEAANGDLWLATPRGVVRVEADTRDISFRAPEVQLVSVRLEGELLDNPPADFELGFNKNRVDVRFAAMSYKAPSQILYRMRLDANEPWRSVDNPEFFFEGLSPGAYRVEVQASHDGESWSQDSASFSFTILPPWYATWWARMLFALLLAAAIYAIYRARVGVLLRLERQRTRIAMDLHDEMGSGLGSIGMMSGILHDDSLDRETRGRIVGQIEENAMELSSALSDIVWTLRPRAHTLGAVASRLKNRAYGLLPSGQVQFSSSEQADRTPISPHVCKNLLSIGSEAIHNAARHGKPTSIELALHRNAKGWILRIADDGQGFARDEVSGDGMGLESMARRASELGGELSIDSQPGQGTRVELQFQLAAKDPRLRPGGSQSSKGHDRAPDAGSRPAQTHPMRRESQ